MQKKVFTFLVFSLSAVFVLAQEPVTVSAKDLKQLRGSWQGSLTYLDYSSGKPYTMPADIKVQQIGKSNQFIFVHIYPDEPKANSSDTLVISSDGKMIDEGTVKSKRKLDNGNTEIVTEYQHVDGNDSKPATIRQTYTFGKHTFTKRKEVQFVGQKEWIKRHEYSYRKK